MLESDLTLPQSTSEIQSIKVGPTKQVPISNYKTMREHITNLYIYQKYLVRIDEGFVKKQDTFLLESMASLFLPSSH